MENLSVTDMLLSRINSNGELQLDKSDTSVILKMLNIEKKELELARQAISRLQDELKLAKEGDLQ